jgi:hypothetical protein
MRKEVETSNNAASFGCSTNNSSLYGLIRGDKPLLRGLYYYFSSQGQVIVTGQKSLRNCKSQNTIMSFNNDVAAAFYDHLLSRCQIVGGFEPTRYFGPEKYEVLDRLKGLNENSLETWFQTPTIHDPNQPFQSQPYNIIKPKTIIKYHMLSS